MICSYCNSEKFILKKSKNICKLCDIIYNFTNNDIYAIMLVKSELSQSEICFKTISYYLKNYTIPYPTDLDPDAKIINFPAYKFIIIYPSLTNKVILDNYKIFFTPDALPSLTRSLFIIKNIEQKTFSFDKLEKQDIDKDHGEIIDKMFYVIE